MHWKQWVLETLYNEEGGMQEKLLTPEQAAVRLHLRPTTLARWRWAGCGPRFFKIGGRVRYAESDLQAFIDAGLRTSTSDTGPESKRASS